MTNFILRRFVALLVVTIRLSLCARQHLTLLDCCAPFQNLLKHMKPQSLVWRSFIFRILLRQTSVFKTFVAMATWRTCWPSMTHDWITPMRSSKRNKSSFNIRKKWLKGQFRVFLGLYNQLITETRSAAKNHWMDWVEVDDLDDVCVGIVRLRFRNRNDLTIVFIMIQKNERGMQLCQSLVESGVPCETEYWV